QCASALYELARLSFNQDDYMSCLEYLTEADTHDKSARNRAAVSLLRGETQMALEKPVDAAKSLKAALSDFNDIGDQRGIAYTLAVSGQVAARLGRCEEARTYLKQAVTKADNAQMPELVLRAIGMTGDAEERCNDPQAAYTDYFASSLLARQLAIPPL